VPHTMLSSLNEAVPHTMLSSLSWVPHAWLLQLFLQSVPQTMFWPVTVVGAPQTTPAFHAVALGLMTPCVIRWLPQFSDWLHSFGCGYVCPGCAVLKYRARSTAPFVFRKPAPCVRKSYPGYTCAVYSRMPFTRLGVSDGFA